MPELPEVETIRRGLMRRRPRAAVVTVWRSSMNLRIGQAWSKNTECLDRLIGLVPMGLERRGKHLLWHFCPPVKRSDEFTLLIHLGMTGNIDVVDSDAKVVTHTHLRLRTGDGKEIRYVDPRRFGGLRVAPAEVLMTQPPLSELGPEPLAADFDGEKLAARSAHSVRPIRDVLLDQRVVAGVGNIYAVEALYVAGLHPLLPARRLLPSAWTRLAEAIQSVLALGLANNGTTLRDYRRPGGAQGSNAAALRVYGRAGNPCFACGVALLGFVSNGRAGAYCPQEQRRPRKYGVA